MDKDKLWELMNKLNDDLNDIHDSMDDSKTIKYIQITLVENKEEN